MIQDDREVVGRDQKARKTGRSENNQVIDGRGRSVSDYQNKNGSRFQALPVWQKKERTKAAGRRKQLQKHKTTSNHEGLSLSRGSENEQCTRGGGMMRGGRQGE